MPALCQGRTSLLNSLAMSSRVTLSPGLETTARFSREAEVSEISYILRF